MRMPCTLVVLVLLTASVAAQPTPQATALFEEGRELAKQQKWAEACEKFQQSLALDPAPGTKLNLGDCLEKQGKVRGGWLMFEEAARDFERLQDARARFARERAAQAAAKLATLVINVAEPSQPGLAIRIGDRAATPQAEIVERVDPGELAVTVTAPNKDPFTATITATAGKTAVVDVPALAGAGGLPEGPKGSEVVVDDRRRKRIIVAIGLGVTGVALLGTSGFLGLAAKSKYDGAFDDGECFDTGSTNVCTPAGKSDVDSARTLADIGSGFAVAGLACAVAGAIVYVTAPSERRISIAPVASSSSAGVVVGGRF